MAQREKEEGLQEGQSRSFHRGKNSRRRFDWKNIRWPIEKKHVLVMQITVAPREFASGQVVWGEKKGGD